MFIFYMTDDYLNTKILFFVIERQYIISHVMRPPTSCMCGNKGADPLRSFAFVFATRIVQFLYSLNTQSPVSSHLLCLYSSDCVEPFRKPHFCFSHDAAHMLTAAANSLKDGLVSRCVWAYM